LSCTAVTILFINIEWGNSADCSQLEWLSWHCSRSHKC